MSMQTDSIVSIKAVGEPDHNTGRVRAGKRGLFSVLGIVAGVGALLGIASTGTAYAQANGRVAVEAKLQVFAGSGITVTGTTGTPPVQSFIQAGTGLANINYTNSVSAAGITTGVVLEPTTGNGSSPGSFNRAQTTLLFTPSITLTNTTNSFQLYQIRYDVTFGAFVNATPNGGTTSSSESVSIILSGTNTGTLSNFNQSLSTLDGLKTDNNPPSSVGGTNGIGPMSSITLSLRTNISVDNQYTVAAAAVAGPEPGSLSLIGMAGLGLAGTALRRRRSVPLSH